jgi:uncharacterized damage-inducible protein DinB
MKAEIEQFFDYNYWANDRLLTRADALSADQLTIKLPTMWDSILRTMAHVLGAEWAWRHRVQEGISPAALLDRDQFSTLDLLRQRWAEEETAMRAYLAGLTNEDLYKSIEYKNTRGETFSRPLWQLLLHVVNHGTQHRSEVALYLTNFDLSPGDMDFSLYLNDHS